MYPDKAERGGDELNGATHLIGGLTTAVIMGMTKPSELVVAAVASLLPDVDRQNSLLGRFIPVLPSLIERVLGKRTLTHSFLFGGILAWVIWLQGWGLFMAFAIGFASHLVLDVVTGKVALLWPLPATFGLPLFGIPPVFVETAAVALWGGWMVTGGYRYFTTLF